MVGNEGSPNLPDHQISDKKRGPAYRTGGIYNMRFYAWMAALFGIAVGVVAGQQAQASMALRSRASRLAVIGVVMFPVRDTVGFWGCWFKPNYGFGPLGPIIYPIKWLGGGQSSWPCSSRRSCSCRGRSGRPRSSSSGRALPGS